MKALADTRYRTEVIACTQNRAQPVHFAISSTEATEPDITMADRHRYDVGKRTVLMKPTPKKCPRVTA